MKLLAGFKHVDWFLVIPLIFIPLFGLTMLLSTAPDLFYRQLINMGIGIVLLLLISQVDKDVFKDVAVPFYIIALVLLTVIFFISDPTRGSVRWIDIGLIRMQPSELAKPLLIVFFAYILRIPYRGIFQSIITPLLLFTIPFFLIFKEPDLGSSIVIASCFFGMFFLSGIRMRYILLIAVMLLAFLPIGWHFTHQYQKERVSAFLNPSSDPLGKAYHMNQSIIAVGSGEFFGRGLGHGTQTQLKFLPEHSTDFIFASLGEELGFVGAIMLVVLYAIIFWRLIFYAQGLDDRFFALIISGVAILFAFQAFIHIGGNIGVLPVTGITLPFISYGGSSIFSNAFSLAIVWSIIRKNAVTSFL